GGPWHKRHANDQYRSNFEDYKAARIPYARNHDSAVHGVYGGPYSHDITNIFPDFRADENDPASYDFPCTDEAILVALDAGTQTFFRLGQTIEHQIKKHGTIPPADFKKWADICEHIIRHYNEGWADGYHLGMQYWEIWNEPDLDKDDSTNKRCWGGTKAQFFDFYEIAAKHLKSCFPDLKIGGPALAGNEQWADDFLREMHARGVEIDFFSWHIYTTEPVALAKKADRIRAIMDKNGYEKAESILNEWNYVKGWTDEYVYSIECMHSVKNGAFIMACMSVSQPAPIDMLMYYDTRPSVFNGVFDFYTYRPLKGYYAMKWYGMFYDLAHDIPALNDIPGIYSLCGVDENGKAMAVVTYYSDDDHAADKEIAVDFGRTGKYEAFLVDADHDASPVDVSEGLSFRLKVDSFVLIREI
ncbi:MAG: hypothetical protein MJ175_13340, partial [Clostridia bacterium]|nr:hypothetical protein [Clostridia bacterium]